MKKNYEVQFIYLELEAANDKLIDTYKEESNADTSAEFQ